MESLDKIAGMGPKTIEKFNKLGIYNIYDLIYYYPRKYDVLVRTNISNINNNDKVIVDGIVEGRPIVSQISFKLKRIIFRISDGSNIYNICVFNKEYLCRELRNGISIIVMGKYDKFRNMIVASEIRMGSLPEIPKIEAIYSITEGLSQKIISKMICNLFSEKIDLIDYIPDYLINKYHFPDKLWSVREIHFPNDIKSYKRAKQRLKYEEFFWYLLRVNYLKFKSKNNVKAIKRVIDVDKLNAFIDKLPFSLTVDQMSVIGEIKNDLISDKRMNRLVQGDVGSGKTIVAFLASYINFLGGYQTALMVPTEILANQHYHEAIFLFKDTDMNICLLTSSINGKKRDKILNEIKAGKVSFIIGTQSLIQDKILYNNLGLIITDEQHRFGVNQRNELKNKGVFPDVLSMSATPIPRTYALTIYGDMDVSSIHTKPSGRKDVITLCKNYDDMLEVLNLMKKELEMGHQIYVIAPAISKDEDTLLDNVFKLKEKMDMAFSKRWSVGAVHGKLDVLEKNDIMKKFENGDIQILISTTVIEVGVNVPNASMIVIFQANLFGLSTLHQLRGRVGRGNIQSYCILMSQEENDRLKLLENTNDGFKISEYDFKTRGEGDLFGIRQSGEAMFRLANIKYDFELLVRVRSDVLEFLNNYLFLDDYKKYRFYLEEND